MTKKCVWLWPPVSQHSWWCSVPGGQCHPPDTPPPPLRRQLEGYKRYSQGDIARAVALVHGGHTLIEAFRATNVPYSSICRFLKNCTAHDGPCKGAKFRPGFRDISGN
ncbi:hypothetical protein ACOMHN_063038 [Nucella lapillus]